VCWLVWPRIRHGCLIAAGCSERGRQMKVPIHCAIGAIPRCADTVHGQPFGWPSSPGRFLPGDRLQGLYDCVNRVTLAAKVRENFLNIHNRLGLSKDIGMTSQNRSEVSSPSVQYCSVCRISAARFCHVQLAALQFRQVGPARDWHDACWNPTKRKVRVVRGKEERWQTSGKQSCPCAAP